MGIAWASRTRPDILAAVSHKQTRCASPRQIDMDDLGYMIGYLANTPSRGIVIDCKELQLYLYVDVGHATHEDKKSHSGGIASCGRLGQGGVPIICKSMKQRIVALSSTEAELVGLSDLFDILLYLERLFKFLCIEELKRPYTVYQDNTSTMTIAYLGRPSSQSRRRFIDIRYFWIKEHLDNNVARLEYLKSADQFADVLASVRSGHAFLHQTTVIMGKP